jgi:ADP-heptose:LPS heptosyltransferase
MKYKIVNRRKRCATAAADAIGTALFLPRTLLRRTPQIRPERIREILVVRTAYIGDVVMTLPLFKPLKERFRAARITLLTSTAAAALVAGHPHLDEVIPYDPFWFYPTGVRGYLAFLRRLRRRRFDLVIEARGDIREILLLAWPLRAPHTVSYAVGGGGWLLSDPVPYPGLRHKVEYHLDIARHLGCTVGPLEWGLRPRPGESEALDALLRGAGVAGAFIAVHPGSRLPLKMWPPERYAALADRLAGRCGLPVVLLGAPGERALADRVAAGMSRGAVNLAGRLDLRGLAGLLARAAVLVCNDSSPMHIAAAVGTPTVAVFGPSKSAETAPFSPVGSVVEKHYPCRERCDESACRNTARPHGCIDDVTVEDVLAAAEAILARSASARA